MLRNGWGCIPLIRTDQPPHEEKIVVTDQGELLRKDTTRGRAEGLEQPHRGHIHGHILFCFLSGSRLDAASDELSMGQGVASAHRK